MSSENTKQSASQRFVVIDRNLAAAKITSKQANFIRPGRYELFSDFQKGMHAITDGKITGAIIDMQVENGASGLAMIAQLRRDPRFLNLPLILTSPTVGAVELQSIHGYSCCAAIAKPVHQKDLRDAFQKVFNESAWYQMNTPRIDQVLKTTEIDPNLANASIKTMLSEAPNPVTLALALGSIMQKQRSYKHAEDVYNTILSQYPRHIPTINAKAKLYTIQGRHIHAKKLLEQSFQLAPKSLERLSLLGEIEVSLKNPEASIKHFHAALGINPDDLKARIGLTISKGYSRLITHQAQFNSAEPSIAKIINNLGVSLAQKGQYEKALKYYLMSLSFLGTEELQSRVSFNMGLGFKKWQKMPQAKYWLEECLRLAGGPTDKAQYHLRGLPEILGEAGLSLQTSLKMPPKNAAAILPRPTAAVFDPIASPIIQKGKSIHIIDFEQSFLDEESVAVGVSAFEKPGRLNTIDDRLFDELEGNLDQMDLGVTFDEAI